MRVCTCTLLCTHSSAFIAMYHSLTQKLLGVQDVVHKLGAEFEPLPALESQALQYYDILSDCAELISKLGLEANEALRQFRVFRTDYPIQFPMDTYDSLSMTTQIWHGLVSHYEHIEQEIYRRQATLARATEAIQRAQNELNMIYEDETRHREAFDTFYQGLEGQVPLPWLNLDFFAEKMPQMTIEPAFLTTKLPLLPSKHPEL